MKNNIIASYDLIDQMKLKQQINHVAIIMDGNDRWAASRNMTTKEGHKAGAENALRIVDAAIKLGVNHLSLFAFSSENWHRPKEEVEHLMQLLGEYAISKVSEINKLNVKVRFVGDLSMLDKSLHNKLKKLEDLSKKNTTMTLYILISYGSRAEIVNAAKRLLQEGLDPDMLTEGNFGNYLYASDMPDVDLLIRPGNVKRISNFLLWQSSYAELDFSTKLWPDFSAQDLKDSIEDYKTRNRRFGGRNG